MSRRHKPVLVSGTNTKADMITGRLNGKVLVALSVTVTPAIERIMVVASCGSEAGQHDEMDFRVLHSRAA